jgi:catechol 2,3-dioxygenase-like lactoylglutathione lyase family enzyme
MRITKSFKPATEDSGEWGGVAYGASHPVFWIDVFHPHGVKQHTAFRARNREEVDAFHAAAVAAGGKDNGPPGFRSGGYPPGYYAAFVLDPDGNIEAVFRESRRRLGDGGCRNLAEPITRPDSGSPRSHAGNLLDIVICHERSVLIRLTANKRDLPSGVAVNPPAVGFDQR